MSATLSTAEKEQYERLVWLLHSLVYALTTSFLKNKKKRVGILNKLSTCAYELLSYTGCGELCYDPEKGCICCDYKLVND